MANRTTTPSYYSQWSQCILETTLLNRGHMNKEGYQNDFDQSCLMDCAKDVASSLRKISLVFWTFATFIGFYAKKSKGEWTHI